MLRPALLLPPMRLLTPRFDPSALALRLGPATGRSGAYPDGTHTRWLAAAFRTRHGPAFYQVSGRRWASRGKVLRLEAHGHLDPAVAARVIEEIGRASCRERV